MPKNEKDNDKSDTIGATFRFEPEFHKKLKIHLINNYPSGYSLNKLVNKLLEEDMKRCTKKANTKNGNK